MKKYKNKSKSQRTRKDPRRAETRTAIIETAEELFAEHGIDGVSMRQIGTAIGSANTSVVAYHFGTKKTLVEAIFHHRLPAMEMRRAELMAEVEAAGQDGDLLALVRALWLPLFEQTNSNGKHSYGNFLSALWRSKWGWSRTDVNSQYPVSIALANRISKALPDVIQPLFLQRLWVSAVIIIGVLQIIDQGTAKEHAIQPELLFYDALRMASAAFTAPVPEKKGADE